MKISKHSSSSKLALCFLLFTVSNTFSQVKYPTDSSFIKSLSNYQKENGFRFGNTDIDTSVNHYQNYYPRNTNGNIGLSSTPLLFKYEAKKLGFKLYKAPYDNDIITEEQIRYYQTKGPYANLTGIAGSKQEQIFKLLFSNTFKNKMNLTLAFNRYSSLGFYRNQQTFTNNFYTSTNYTTKNNRAGYYAFFLFNRLKHQENGGIKNDTLFLQNTFINKQTLPVNLVSAKRDVRFTSVSVNPWFRLNKVADSSAALSHFIDYELNYEGNFSKYTDPGIATETYYSAIYLDTVTTKDSTHWRKIANSFNYTLKLNAINARLKLGVKNEYNKVHQFTDTLLINNLVSLGFFMEDDDYEGSIKGSYIVNGTNANDYSFEIKNKYSKKIMYDFFKMPFVFSLNVNFERRQPDFIYNSWTSNNFIWVNRFLPTEKQQFLFSVSTPNKRFDVGVLGQNINQQLYFNEYGMPQQVNSTIKNATFFIHKDVVFFKHLGINAQYNYQTSSYQAIVSIPNHIVNSAIYYQGNLFKNALQLQVGFNVQYFSKFNGLAYTPATNTYHVQDSRMVGDYTYVDFFINARIKPVRIFVKVDHLNQGFSGKNYALAAGYLQNDRAFKFGINWLFFD